MTPSLKLTENQQRFIFNHFVAANKDRGLTNDQLAHLWRKYLAEAITLPDPATFVEMEISTQ